MKLHLIAPSRNAQRGKKRKFGSGFFRVPPLGLMNVAALTPSGWDVSITDENIDELSDSDDPDLVGISVMTASADRAYEIADSYRIRGIPVVLGGVHVSFLHQEALQHADSIVLGEAEGIWTNVLDDFKKGGKEALVPVYKADKVPELTDYPIPSPDHNGLAGTYVLDNLLNITRGCPHNCSFCSVTRLLGKKIRYRPVQDVVDHIASRLAAKEKPTLRDRFYIFVDDNIMANRAYAKELFKALIPLNILWISQTSINSAYDEEMLELAARSGCVGVFIGLESISQDSLDEIKKTQNHPGFYRQGVKRFQKKGIFVEGAFIFGFDHDEPSVFRRTADFACRLGLDGVQYTILTPLPGTDFYNEIEEGNRFIDHKWSHYDTIHLVFNHPTMSAEEMEAGLHYAYKKTYSLRGILTRAVQALGDRRWKFFFMLLAFNFGYRRSFKYMWKTAFDPSRGKHRRANYPARSDEDRLRKEERPA